MHRHLNVTQTLQMNCINMMLSSKYLCTAFKRPYEVHDFKYLLQMNSQHRQQQQMIDILLNWSVKKTFSNRRYI